MSTSTRRRVPSHTDDFINQVIEEGTKKRIKRFSENLQGISFRIRELDREWDIERILALNSSTLSLLGLVLGFTRDKKWFILPLAVQGFFMEHAFQGWCPPLPILRRLGFRTQDEINYERYALKFLRGDFTDIESAGTFSEPEDIFDAVTT